MYSEQLVVLSYMPLIIYPFLHDFLCHITALLLHVYFLQLSPQLIALPGDPKKYSCLIKREMHTKENFSEMKYLWTTNELT